MKKRVYEIAKEFDIQGKELLAIINSMGINASSTLNTLEADEVKKVEERLNKKEVSNTNLKDTGDVNQKIVVTINRNIDGDIKVKKVSIEQLDKEGETEKVIEESHKKENGKKEVKKRLIIKKEDHEDNSLDNKDEDKDKELKRVIDTKIEAQETKAEEEEQVSKESKVEEKIEEKKVEQSKEISTKEVSNINRTKNENIAKVEDKKVDKKEKYKKDRPKDKFQNQRSNKDDKKNERKFEDKRQESKPNQSKSQDRPKKDGDKKFKKDFKDGDEGNKFKGRKKSVKREEPEEILPEKPRRNYKQSTKKKDKCREEVENESFKKKAEQNKEKKTTKKVEKKDEIKIIEIDNEIVVKDFADKLGVSPSKIIQKLIILGVMASQNETIDFDVAQLVGEEFNAIVEQKKEVEPEEVNVEEEFKLDFEDKEEDLLMRGPIVTVMGHVDHGKTSLLDAIKSTNVTGGEAGGITQHIGAYMVGVGSKKICFIDTPGHEAFTSMRARGAQVTDIAILVVAADDGVMPQTIEAINHAKAANVPIVVAINKIDKPEANVDRIKQELVEHSLVPEEWGGDVITVPVSAKQRTGIEELLEMVLLVAEMQNLKANPNRTVVGTVIEAELDKHQGAKATVIISKGTLKVGDMVVSGSSYGKVRTMLDDKGKNMKKAGPSTPVVIYGLSQVPNAGDLIYSTMNDKQAKNAAQMVIDLEKEEMFRAGKKVSLDDLFEQIKLGEIKDLNIIIKADGKGSIEALKSSLSKMQTEEVKPNVIHEGVGGITESDVMLASASNAIVVGFNVRPNVNAIEKAKNEEVDIRTYRVIYDVIEDIKSAIIGMHSPKIVEEVIGHLEVRNVFGLPNGQKVAGIYVKSGKVLRKAMVRLIRDDVIIAEKGIASLKRFKDDAKEVLTGFEAGLGIENYNDIKVGDEIEVFIDKEVETELDI